MSPVQPEPDPIRAALGAYLSGDDELMAIATGVHEEVAPAKAVYPYVIFARQAPGRLIWSMRDYFREQLWLVKGICRGSDAAPAESIDRRCEALLRDADLIIAGGRLMDLRRESDMLPLGRPDNGEVVYHRGGLYRLQVEPT